MSYYHYHSDFVFLCFSHSLPFSCSYPLCPQALSFIWHSSPGQPILCSRHQATRQSTTLNASTSLLFHGRCDSRFEPRIAPSSSPSPLEAYGPPLLQTVTAITEQTICHQPLPFGMSTAFNGRLRQSHKGMPSQERDIRGIVAVFI